MPLCNIRGQVTLKHLRGEPGSAEPLTFRLDAERPICTVVRTGSDRWFEDRAQLTAAIGPAEPVPAYGHAAGIVPGRGRDRRRAASRRAQAG